MAHKQPKDVLLRDARWHDLAETGLWFETPMDLATWGPSRPHVRHVVPGRSLQHQPKILKYFSPILARFGGRVEKAFDNITIARKP